MPVITAPLDSNLHLDTPDSDELFPIREVSRLTGINPVTLRAWERRYGLIQPTRTESGHRLYSKADIETVNRILDWIERGVAVSKVGKLLARDDQQAQAVRAERAERDAKHKMALVFRAYLGLSSRWANAGEPSRVMDYQVWCGPAMGAFNEWTRGTFLEKPENRRAEVVALNLLYGAATHLRAHALRMQGIPLLPGEAVCAPLELNRLHELLNAKPA